MQTKQVNLFTQERGRTFTKVRRSCFSGLKLSEGAGGWTRHVLLQDFRGKKQQQFCSDSFQHGDPLELAYCSLCGEGTATAYSNRPPKKPVKSTWGTFERTDESLFDLWVTAAAVPKHDTRCSCVFLLINTPGAPILHLLISGWMALWQHPWVTWEAAHPGCKRHPLGDMSCATWENVARVTYQRGLLSWRVRGRLQLNNTCTNALIWCPLSTVFFCKT